MRNKLISFFLLIVMALTACAQNPGPLSPDQVTPQPTADKTMSFVIGSESEQFMLQVVQPWFQAQGWQAPYVKLGSVDQKILLQSGKVVDQNGQAYNVVLPASQIWTA